MKKYILLVFLLLSFVKVDVFATDACDRLVPQYANFVWKATFWSNLRDYPCISKSNVLGVSKVGELYTVISKVDGWYQIKTGEGKIYRIRDQAIVQTSNPVIYEPVEEKVVENTGYQLTSADRLLVNKFVYKMNIIIQQKWLAYKNLLVNKLSNFLADWKYSTRLIAVLEEIKNQISKIEIVSEKQEESVKYVLNNTYDLENIDISRVKNTWLGWYNDVRSDLWKKAYSYDSTLEKTALDWSQRSADRGEITHKRNEGDDYYDYDIITSWFKDRGVVCKNIYWVTHTENIWYWSFSCNDSECTDELIGWIRSTFDFYMWEKYKSYQPHYESIINSYFTKIWLWIELEEQSNWNYKYYLTVDYCTELID